MPGNKKVSRGLERLSNPKSLLELCVAAARENNLVKDLDCPVLFDRHFRTELDLNFAYKFGNVECVEKCFADPHAVVRACARYGNVKTALATQHLFPAGCRVYGSVGYREQDGYRFFERESPKIYNDPWHGQRRYLRMVRERDGALGLVDLESLDFPERVQYTNEFQITTDIDEFRTDPHEQTAVGFCCACNTDKGYWGFMCWGCLDVAIEESWGYYKNGDPPFESSESD